MNVVVEEFLYSTLFVHKVLLTFLHMVLFFSNSNTATKIVARAQ